FDLNISNWQAFAALVAVFTFLNIIIKPLIRFFLGPLVILTFGLFNLVITGGLLYILDLYSQNLTITGLSALVAGTLIITVVNMIIHVVHRPKS
ncbi:phage holin family protein, partial [Candidatus Berkelbacteria bacterium]|nr:phage holin family protein [Candidatus Berkelbacteria bacterium]